ncbi:MAG: hypothetical protein GY768_03585 [Planctomycetaceae bacterium]|nr:hypothetical protein [Planctomycetaceae bacterium]
MRYIQLSTLPLPPSADISVMFPFLREDGEEYRLAWLVSDGNQAAAAALMSLGFELDTSTYHGDSPAGDWSFFTCISRTDKEGPFHPLSVAVGTPSELALATYINWDLPAGGSVVAPTALKVRQAVVDEVGHNTNAIFGLEKLEFREVSVRNWQFATANNTTDVAVSFILPFSGEAPQTGEIESTWDVNPLPNEDDSWGGAQLRIDNVVVLGGPNDRIALVGAALTTTSDDGVLVELAYESESTGIDLGLLNSRLIRFHITSQLLRVRYGEQCVGLLLFPSGVASDIMVRFELRFPLIMKTVEEVAEAIAIKVPLLKQSLPGDLEFLFNAVISSAWDAANKPMLHLGGRGWRLDSAFLDGVADEIINLDAKPLFSSLSLGGLDLSIADLVGDVLGGVSFGFRRPQGQLRVQPKIEKNGTQWILKIPIGLSVVIGQQPLDFTVQIEVDPNNFRLSTNRLRFRLPRSLHGQPAQVIDLEVLALLIPNRDPESTTDDFDGYLDFEKGEIALIASAEQPAPNVLFPGSLDAHGLKKRLLFSLDKDFDPDHWPNEDGSATPAQRVYFRINRDGVSMRAKIETSHETTVLADIPAMPDVKLRPHKKKKGVTSEFVIIDNVIRAGAISCEMDVPGTDDLTAELELGLRQNKRGVPPTVYATLALDSDEPLAQLSAGYLQLRIDTPVRDWKLEWNTANNDWNVSLPSDGALSLSPRTTSSGGIEDLRKKDIIRFRGLDLVNLHKGAAEIELPLDDFVEFKLLDGMFQVRLTQLRFGWGETFFLSCDEADFQFQNPGALDVTITAGNLRLDFLGGTRMKLRNPSRLGIDVIVGDSVRYRGAVAWVDEERVRYFAAAGTLSITGMPEASTVLKLGSGYKENGQLVPNVAFFGSLEKEVQLFSGVVAKSFGAGIGINNQLRGIGERPNAETVLARIDDIQPADEKGWEFVTRNGFFLSIVGTTELTSNTGANDTVNAYVASLILSIDIDLNVVAAGKVWLSSSVQYVRNPSNSNRPALAGAIVISPRQRLISAALESRPDPAIEANEQLSNILNKGHIKFSFLMSPKVVDFYLQDVSYREEFLGIQMLYQGSLRLAIFRGTVLLRATQQITGHFERRLEASPGGFEARGDVSVLIEFGGLLSTSGLAAYGLIDFSLSLRFSAWITIGFSFTIGAGRWRKSIRFSKTFDLGATQLELGLRGAIAFDESGDFGFEGSLSISVSICGYPLNISPSLKFNEQVISRVRGRVAAFERRLEEYRRELLDRPETGSFAAAESLTAPAEKWLWYQQGDWHLLLPAAGTTWLIPEASPGPADADGQVSIEFNRHVIGLEVRNSAGAVVARITPPWVRNAGAADPIPPGSIPQAVREAQLEEAKTIMAETHGGPGVSLAEYPVHTDPRVESIALDYWPDEELGRPDFAPPVAMRSPDALLQSASLPDSFDSDYRRLVDYLYWRSRSLRHQLHRNGDTDDVDDAIGNRCGLAALLLDELQAVADPEHHSAWRGYPYPYDAPVSGDPKFFGWIFGLPVEDPGSYTFHVQRFDGSDDPPFVLMATPARPLCKVQQARAAIRPLPPRQAFVVDQVGDADGNDERGRAIVKLPVHFDPTAFASLLPTISHLQVWRQMPWESESETKLVGDLLRPDMALVDEESDSEAPSRAMVLGPYIFTDEFPVVERQPSSKSAVDQGIKYELKLIPVGDNSDPSPTNSVPWQAIPLYIPPRSTFPDQPGIVIPAPDLFDDARKIRFALAALDTESTRPATVTRDQQKRLLTAEDFELWVTEGTETTGKGFYVGGEDLDDGTDASTDPLLDDVGTSAPVDAFNTLDKRRVQFDPVDVEAQPAWFFLDTSNMTDSELNRSELGLQAGRSFRFFVRERTRAGDGTLRAQGPVLELKPLIVRPDKDGELPSVKASVDAEGWKWVHPPRFRAVDDIERISITDREVVTESNFTIVPVKVQLRPMEPWNDLLALNTPTAKLRQLRRRLGLSWQTDLVAGGIELVIRDVDDSSLQHRMLCETLGEEVFRRRIADFSNASLWQLTHQEQINRRLFFHDPSVPDPSVLIADAEVNAKVIAEFFLFLDATNPILKQLEDRCQRMANALDSNSNNWRDVFPPLKNWLTAVFAFEKSPLNLNDLDLREVLAKIRALAEHALTGRFDAVLDGSDSGDPCDPPAERNQPKRLGERLGQINEAARERLSAELDNLLTTIDNTQIDERQFDDETEEQRVAARRAFLDLRIAGKLAAIIRRRRNVARELFTGASPRVPETGDLDQSSWLPRGARWNQLRAEQQRHVTELGEMPLSQQLLDFFPPVDAKSPDQSRAAQRLKDAANLLQSLATLAKNNPSRDDRAKKVAKVVTKAAGLTKAMIQIRRTLASDEWTLVTRPHHQVATRRDDDDALDPVLTPFASFQSDEHRVGNEASELPNTESIALANLLERMGFAVDLAMFDELQQQLDQAEVLRAIERSKIGLDLNEVCFVLAGREQDSEYRGGVPDPVGSEDWKPFIGYSFVKLAVVPKPFFDLLTSNLAEAANKDALQKWLEFRNIELGAEEQWLSLARRLGRVAAYLRFSPACAAGPQRIRVESRDRRWSMVPAVQGEAHVDWEIPDRRDHRFFVGGRTVSRYEPFIRWALGITDKASTFSALDIDVDEVSVRRIIADPDEERPAPLPVAVYPHPEMVRFSYILPPAGARSIYNVVSAVRTGYAGCRLTFRRRLIDHDQEARRWRQVMAEAELQPGEINDPPPVIRHTPRNEASDVRLFRHERLVELEDQPYFFEYGLDVQSQFDADALQHFGNEQFDEAAARRSPGWISLRHATVTPPDIYPPDLVRDYELEIPLTRTGDLLSGPELVSGPALEPITTDVLLPRGDTTSLEIPHTDCPI